MGRPLDGVTVLSFEVQVAGPYCSMMLADQGATVIKVEQPGSGDTSRSAAPILESNAGESRSGYFLRFNRNKKSLTLDVKSERGRRIFADIAKQVDVVIDNYRPGILRDLGLGYEELAARNPGLVYVSISGFGSTDSLRGPFADRPAYDIVAQAMGGLMFTCGAADGPPTWLGVALGDIVTGMNAAYATMLALYKRASDGFGQYVDIAMYDTIVGLAERSVTTYSLTGNVLERGRELFMAPWGPFQCEDGWVALIVATERDWGRFCQAIDREDLIGAPGASSGPDRAEAMRGDLGTTVRGWFASRSVSQACSTILAAGLPIGPVQNAKEVFESPQTASRRLLLDVPDPILGSVRLVGSPIKLSQSLEGRAEAAPRLGEDTEVVLKDFLDLSTSDIAGLRKDGVI